MPTVHNSTISLRPVSNQRQRIRCTKEGCRAWAVFGYDRCNWHGREKLTENLMRYGLTGDLGKTYDAFVRDDEFFSLREEVGIIRTLLDAVLKTMDAVTQAKGQLPLNAIPLVQSLVSQTSALVTRAAELEGRLGHHVDINAFKFILDELVRVVETEVRDPQVVLRVCDAFDKLPWRPGLPAPQAASIGSDVSGSMAG